MVFFELQSFGVVSCVGNKVKVFRFSDNILGAKMQKYKTEIKFELIKMYEKDFTERV